MKVPGSVRRVGVGAGIAALAGSTGVVLAAALAPTPWALPLVPFVVLGAVLAVRSPLAALVTALVLAPVGLMHLGGALKVAQACALPIPRKRTHFSRASIGRAGRFSQSKGCSFFRNDPAKVQYRALHRRPTNAAPDRMPARFAANDLRGLAG